MLRTLFVTAASSAVLLAATSAGAQEAAAGFGGKGQFIISADRLAPLFTYSNNKVTDNDRNPSTTTTSIGLLPSFNHIGVNNGNFYNIPRFGFDYTIIDRLTLGGNIGFAANLGASTSEAPRVGPSYTVDADKFTYFSISPRVGYILPLSDLFAFWPRGGFGFHSLHTNHPDIVINGVVDRKGTTDNLTQWAINLEPLFVLTPAQHFGIFAGPVVDIPFAGSLSHTDGGVTTSYDTSMFHFGITAGLLGWF